eukprot:Skav228245  [mRNA]  locus=scaffold3112:187504:189084:+ [translate_table: standard]
METLRERLCKESSAAENEWAKASKALADARTKDDDLRSEVKWRLAEKQAAERALAEAESRQTAASAGVIQAERQSTTAAATLAQKQALLGQLWDHEAQILQQSKLIDEAQQDAQQAKAKAEEGQHQLEAALQELRSVRAQHEHNKYIVQTLQEQNSKLTEDLKAFEDVKQQQELNRNKLDLIETERGILEKEVKAHQAEKESLSEKCRQSEVQLLEMKSRESRMSLQVTALQEALMTAQNDAAALRARLESRVRQREAEPCPLVGHGTDHFQGSSSKASASQAQDAQAHEARERQPTAPESIPDLVPKSSAPKPQMATETPGGDRGDLKRQNDERIEDAKRRRERSQPGEDQRVPAASSVSEFPPKQAGTSPHIRQSSMAKRPSLWRHRGFGLSDMPKHSKPKAGEPARAPKRSKEEVERLAHSMFSTKPEPRHLRAPPLKLYAAHIEYVLSNWDAYIAKYGHGQHGRPISQGLKGLTSKSDDLRPIQQSAVPGSWQAVQNFLKASAGEGPSQRTHCIVSRACAKG